MISTKRSLSNLAGSPACNSMLYVGGATYDSSRKVKQGNQNNCILLGTFLYNSMYMGQKYVVKYSFIYFVTSKPTTKVATSLGHSPGNTE